MLQSGTNLLPYLQFAVPSVPICRSTTVSRPYLSQLRYPLHSPVKSILSLPQVHLPLREVLCSLLLFQALPLRGMHSLQVFQAFACMSPFLLLLSSACLCQFVSRNLFLSVSVMSFLNYVESIPHTFSFFYII